MTLDQRLTEAARHVAGSLSPPEINVDHIRARARSRRLARMTAIATVAIAMIVAFGMLTVGNLGPNTPVEPATAPAPSPTTSETLHAPIDTTSWTRFTSERYDLTVGHPADWTVRPARRDWTWEQDAEDFLSEAHEAFVSPSIDVRVSVWAAPLKSGTTVESLDDLQAWVRDYCETSGNSPCEGIEDRAVELCLEKRDCHPGILVPFKDDVQAFFSGGIYDAEKMTIVSVWRPESAPAVEPYGGAQRLLEGFLSTMQVWPSSTPLGARTPPSAPVELGSFPLPSNTALPVSVATELQGVLDAAVREGSARGATAAVIVAGEGRWSGAAGIDRQGRTLTPTSELLTASVGKTVTAAQVLRLAEDGVVGLEDRAANHFPPELAQFDANNASVRDLLGMRSGLRDPGAYGTLVDQGLTTADLVELVPEPAKWDGTSAQYANINYLLLGEIMEEATGLGFAELVNQDVLQDVYLKGIRYDIQDAMAADGWRMTADALSLAKWGYELYGGRILNPTSLQAMVQFNGSSYGYGTLDLSDYGVTGAVGHGGMEESHSAILIAVPDQGVVVAVLANSDHLNDIRGLVQALSDVALASG